LERLAKQGSAVAQYDLGVKYDLGQGVPRNEKEAVRWYRKAAEQGHFEAPYKLGLAYETGIGVRKSSTQAFKWYRIAFEMGHAKAQHNLFSMYESNGFGVQTHQFPVGADEFEFHHFFAEQGDAFAQYWIGHIYQHGKLVPRDTAKALKWLRQAARQGLLEAQFYLSDLGEQLRTECYSQRIDLLNSFVSPDELRGARIFAFVTYHESHGEEDFKKILEQEGRGVYMTVRLNRKRDGDDALYCALKEHRDEYDVGDILAIIRGGGDTSDRQFSVYNSENASEYLRELEDEKCVITVTGIGHARDSFEVDQHALFPMITPTQAAYKIVSIVTGNLST